MRIPAFTIFTAYVVRFSDFTVTSAIVHSFTCENTGSNGRVFKVHLSTSVSSCGPGVTPAMPYSQHGSEPRATFVGTESYRPASSLIASRTDYGILRHHITMVLHLQPTQGLCCLSVSTFHTAAASLSIQTLVGWAKENAAELVPFVVHTPDDQLARQGDTPAPSRAFAAAATKILPLSFRKAMTNGH